MHPFRRGDLVLFYPGGRHARVVRIADPSAGHPARDPHYHTIPALHEDTGAGVPARHLHPLDTPVFELQFARYLDLVAASLNPTADPSALLPLELGDHGQVGKVDHNPATHTFTARVGTHPVATSPAPTLAQALPHLAATLRRTFAKPSA